MKKHIAIPITIILSLTLSLSILITALAYPWPDRNLEFGMTGDDVLSLQMALEEEGISTGSLDGYFGALTENALMTYQSWYGLVVDGVAGPQTYSSLFGESGQQTQADTGTGEISRSLSRGMYGSDVTTLQRLLNSLGYYDGYLDGDFGGMTEGAVVAFQSDNGLYVDGVVGPITLNALYSGAPAQEGRAQAAPDGSVSFDRSLYRGSYGSDVTALQKMLQQLGYYSGTIDGDFGGMTESAVIAFQQAKGLYVDGVAGPITIGELQGLTNTKPAAAAQTQEDEEEEEDKGTPASEAVVLTNISNAPGGIEIDWAKVDGINTYRVFKLDNSGSWAAIGDTSSTYFIDQNVVSGNRYTYTVRSVAADGSYPGDYNRSGISFTYTYNYDTYVANAPGYITKEMVAEKAKALGLDNNEILGLVAWVQGEGYTNIGVPYMDYLAACVVVNGLLDGVYSRGEDFIKQIESWGDSYFSAENLKRRYENASQGTLLAVYLALTNRQPGIYFCRGALEKPDGCFYDSGLIIEGEYSYVW